MTARGRVVVITGASSGIGRAAALAFARRGDRLVLAARRADALAETLAACGGEAAGRTVVCDVASHDAVASLAASVREREGRCDVLVNNAGVGAREPFRDAGAIGRLDEVMQVNLLGAARLTAHLLPLLRECAPGSAIVNVSSVAGLLGAPGAPIYCASKFALTGFSESLHFELAREGVHVACVHPGPVVTEGFPHPRLAARRGGGMLIADVDAVARLIVRASCGKGTPFPVIPRIFRLGVLARDLCPPLYRFAMRGAVSRMYGVGRD